MREKQETERKATIEKHEATMQAMKAGILAMELEQAKELTEVMGRGEEEISAAMQEFETKVAARRVYHEAPDDVFELIVLQLPDLDKNGWGKGDLNALRLVSKRCLRVVESVATRLMHEGNTDSLPVAVLNRCKRIELSIWNLPLIKDLTFFEEGITKLRALNISFLPVNDLSPLIRLQELEELDCPYIPWTTSLLPLARCLKLKAIDCSDEAKDLAELREKRSDLLINNYY